jgi:hypothetical protein
VADVLRVFLCYSSGDKAAVRDLYGRLRSEPDLQPWLDEEEIIGGQNWRDAIEKAVRESHVVIVCLSRSSVVKEGYIQKELRYALDVADEKPDNAIFIIPMKLEECDVPARLRGWQWVNLFEANGYDRLIRALKHRGRELGIDLSKYWPLGERSNEYWKERTAIVNCAYQWELTVLNKNVTAELPSNLPATSDFELQAALELVHGSNLVYGFFFRRTDQGGYYFLLSDKGQCGLNIWNVTTGEIKHKIPWAFSPATKPRGSNTLMIRVERSHISIHLNDSVVGDVIDDTLSRGQLGLAAQLSEGPSALIAMNEFKLALLNPSPTRS